jgi:low temperature requirement protein LtrA
MSVPDAAGAEQRTTPAELLWDLVFVFAVTQVTTLLYNDLSWAGFGRAMLVLALVWWAWSAFVWAMNAHDPDELPVRGVLFLAMILTFILALSLPSAFGEEATVFALAYTGVRLLHLCLYVAASRRGNARVAAIAGFAATVAISMALLLTGSVLGDPARIWLWVTAAAIDYAGPAWLTRERLRGIQQVAVSHFAERYSLFIIICLGESIIAIGVAAADRDLDAELLTAVALAVLVTVGLWWAYFDHVAGQAQNRLAAHDEPVLAAADAYSYLHLLLVSGIIVAGIGLKASVGHPAEPLRDGARLALCGGVGLYLGGHIAFGLRLVGELSLDKAAAAGACMIVFIAAAESPAWVTVGMLAAVLALLITSEHRRRRSVAHGRSVSRLVVAPAGLPLARTTAEHIGYDAREGREDRGGQGSEHGGEGQLRRIGAGLCHRERDREDRGDAPEPERYGREANPGRSPRRVSSEVSHCPQKGEGADPAPEPGS